LPFTEFYLRNPENRIGGASRCVDNFSNSLRENSKGMLNKSPIYSYIISPIFFHLYHAENGKDNSSSKKHLKSKKNSIGSELDLELSILVKKRIESGDPIPFTVRNFL
jgi:hypothetical protein